MMHDISLDRESTPKCLLFTDAASSPQTGIAIGAFLYLTPAELETYQELSPTELNQRLVEKILYKSYESKKSTWSEIKTTIDALSLIQQNIPQIQEIDIYTDCQTVCDLMTKRKDKLQNNNFMSRSGKVLNNAELYKEFFCIAEKFKITVFKIKGHASIANRITIQEKIFSMVDKSSRKYLRTLVRCRK